jgi:hypothetical protein
LDGRNFSQLGLLQPGVVPLTPRLLEAGGPARPGQAYADGQRPESNNFLIDGAGELFNVLNHTNFRLPVSDIESPTFGQIQSDVSPRVIQVALKFLF